MLETLVTPRIRRTLLEYLLAHPSDRFYLRGLAKDLNLPISPLRRELKRLERAQMLSAVPEGNMLFYAVKADSPAFLQLRRMEVPLPSIPLEAVHIETTPSLWRTALPTPLLLATSTVGMTLVLIVAGLFYLTMTNRQAVSQAFRILSTRKAAVTIVAPPSAAGTMRGAKWQVTPGGFSGFSSGASHESY